MSQRWIIPDIHGCVKTVKALMENLLRVTKYDVVYFLGDYIDRGPDSKGVIDYLMHLKEEEYNVHFLKGNHEDLCVTAYEADQKKKLFAIGIALYLAGFLIKYGLQDYMFIKYGYVSNRFRWLQCTPCFITAAGIFLSTYSIGSLIKRGGIPSRIINFVGSCTFAIYLFHMLVISETGGWRNFFFMKFGHETTFFSTFAYYLSYAFAVFGVALIIAAIFKYAIEKPIERLFRRWLVQR